MHNEAIKMAKHAMTDACAKGYDCMTSQDWDDLKDCVETAKNAIECDYYYRLVERMKKDEEEEKREDAYFLNMLKDEYRDDYKRMKDEYGEEEGERRFYDNYRYANGRFAPKGRGSYMPKSSGRRGYVEPPYYHMMPDDYLHGMDGYDYGEAERNRDLDRKSMNRMYYTPVSGNSENKVGSSANTSNERTGSYSDGYSEGSRRGYEEGYEKGKYDGKRSGNGSQSRSDRMRRNYTENKHMNDNSPEGKKKNMENLDSYMKELAGEMTELVEDMDASEKNMVRSKLQTLASKIQ